MWVTRGGRERVREHNRDRDTQGYSGVGTVTHAVSSSPVVVCISYCSVAVIKHYDQKQRMEQGVYSGLCFQRDKSPSWQGSMAKAAGMAGPGC